MRGQPQRTFLPMRLKLGLVFLVLLLGMAMFLIGYFPDRMAAVAEEWAESGGIGTAEVLASAVAPGVEFAEMGMESARDSVREILAKVHQRQQGRVLYAAVVRPDGTALAEVGSRDREVAPPELADQPHKHVTGGALHVAVPIVSSLEEVTGHLLVGFSLSGLRQERDRHRQAVILVSVAMVAIGLAVSMVVGTVLVRPIRQLTEVTAAIVARGDLSQRIDVRSHDEIGLLAERFAEMVEKLRAIPRGLSELVEGLVDVTRQLSATAGTVSSGAAVLRAHVSSTSQAMQEMLASFQEVGNSVRELQRNTEASAASNQEMSATTREVLESVNRMVASVEATHTAITTMMSSIQETAHSIDELDNSLDETSAAMREISASIARVESGAQGTAMLSTEVSQDSEQGVEALQATLEGIERIRESNDTVSEVMSTLEERVGAIDVILDAINDITARTNLLALNAAITAAQAGEHGRGFAVVAAEIKALAERTATATREIGDLIAGMNEISHHASTVVDEGTRSVREGVTLGVQASDALRKIYESARRATDQVRSIAAATQEQSGAIRRVSTSVERIAKAVQHINNESNRQASGSDEIVTLTKQMRSMTGQVKRSSEQQARRTEQIGASVSTIEAMVSRVSAAQRQQSSAAERVLHNVESVQRVADEQSQAVDSLHHAIGSLLERAEALRQAVRQFVV